MDSEGGTVAVISLVASLFAFFLLILVRNECHRGKSAEAQQRELMRMRDAARRRGVAAATVRVAPTAPMMDVESIRAMSPTERKTYVSNVLKTQEFMLPKAADAKADSSRTQYIEEHGNISIRSCAICLEEFHANEAVCTSNNPDCEHIYHHKCIFDWLLGNENCPCCRREYLAFETVDDLETGL